MFFFPQFSQASGLIVILSYVWFYPLFLQSSHLATPKSMQQLSRETKYVHHLREFNWLVFFSPIIYFYCAGNWILFFFFLNWSQFCPYLEIAIFFSPMLYWWDSLAKVYKPCMLYVQPLSSIFRFYLNSPRAVCAVCIIGCSWRWMSMWCATTPFPFSIQQ